MKNISNKIKLFKNKKAVASLIAIVVSVTLVASLSIGVFSFLSTSIRNTAETEINNITSDVLGIGNALRNDQSLGDGGIIPDVPVLSQTALKFGQVYATSDGTSMIAIFYEDGSAILVMGEQTIEFPAGTITWDGNNLYATEDETTVLLGIVSSDGLSIDCSVSFGFSLYTGSVTLQYGVPYQIPLSPGFGQIIFYEDGRFLFGSLEGLYFIIGHNININVNGTNGMSFVVSHDGNAIELPGVARLTVNGEVLPYEIKYGVPYTNDGESVYIFFEDGSYYSMYCGSTVKYYSDANSYSYDGSIITLKDGRQIAASAMVYAYGDYYYYFPEGTTFVNVEGAVYNTEKTTLYATDINSSEAIDFIVPNTVKEIRDRVICFWKGTIKSIYIPSSVDSWICSGYDSTNLGALKDIYYEGTEEQWNLIDGIYSAEQFNSYGVTVHFNS